MIHCLLSINQFNVTDCFLQRAETKFSQIFTNFFCDVFEEVHNELRLAVESLTQFRVLCSNTDRARMHHDASAHHKWGRSETELFCAEQCCNDDIATSFHLAVCLHHNAVTQAIQHQCLLCFCKTKFPWGSCMLQRSQWRCTSSAVMTRDEHHVCFCFADAGRNCADSDFGNQLHMNAC